MRRILFTLLGGLVCGLCGLISYFTLPDWWDALLLHRPEYTFRVFVANPIPEGVSNIQAYDISMGFDQEIDLAFKATPEAINEIIAFNQLKLINDTEFVSDPPFEIFREVNWNRGWTPYRKRTRISKVESLTMWVNPERNTVIFEYIYG